MSLTDSASLSSVLWQYSHTAMTEAAERNLTSAPQLGQETVCMGVRRLSALAGPQASQVVCPLPNPPRFAREKVTMRRHHVSGPPLVSPSNVGTHAGFRPAHDERLRADERDASGAVWKHPHPSADQLLQNLGLR